jgi:hypothetical protein
LLTAYGELLLLNGLIQPFQQPERMLGFFNTYREGKRVIRKTLTEITDQFQYWLKNRAAKWGEMRCSERNRDDAAFANPEVHEAL